MDDDSRRLESVAGNARKMTKGKRYFLGSLALPVVVPFVGLVVGFIASWDLLRSLAVIFVASLFFGGIPYVVLCVLVVVWARDKSAGQLRRLSYVMPLIYVVVLGSYHFVWVSFASGSLFVGQEFPGFLKGELLFAGYGLLFGYLYVLLVNFVYELTLSRYEEDEKG